MDAELEVQDAALADLGGDAVEDLFPPVVAARHVEALGSHPAANFQVVGRGVQGVHGTLAKTRADHSQQVLMHVTHPGAESAVVAPRIVNRFALEIDRSVAIAAVEMERSPLSIIDGDRGREGLG